MKILNVDLIRHKQGKLFIRTEEIAKYLDLSLEDRYGHLYIKSLPSSKVKKLCQLLNIKESEVYIRP